MLKGVPLSSDYNETVYWSPQQGITGQVAGFMAYTNILITSHMYQRINDGVLRINRKSDNIYDYNYMMFKNVGYVSGSTIDYADKWFFAFIKEVQYVNEQACNVIYEIDEIQTWWFETTLKACYIEREHSASDVIGEHTLTEPIDLGSMICTEESTPLISVVNDFDNVIMCFCIPSSNDDNNQSGYDWTHSGYLIDGIYTGAVPIAFDTGLSDINTFNSFIETLIDNREEDRIVSLVMFPKMFRPTLDGTTIINGTSKEFDVARPTTVDGYQPRNKKLLTAPYIFFNIDVQSDSKAFRYEYFNDPTACHFWCMPCITPNPEIIVVPFNYNGNSTFNITDSLVMDGFPQCAFAVDGYRAYLAQRATEYVFEQAKNLSQIQMGGVGIGVGIATENLGMAVSGASNLEQGIIGAAESAYTNSVESNRGSSSRGVTGTSASLGHKLRTVYVRKMSIKAEYARMIDDFFSRFGYACSRVKVPNTNVRQNWTYTKTVGASITGNLPASSLEKIKSLYNRGITFFNNIQNVGNYSLPNDPV